MKGLKCMSVNKDFEKIPWVKNFIETFDVYYTNLGGYISRLDDKPCFYLNGALRMYEMMNDKSN